MRAIWAVPALCAVLITGSFAGPARAAVYGDADNSGTVNLQDVRALLQAAGGLAPLTATERRYGDVAPVNDQNAGSFGDGRITLLDALRVAVKVNNPAIADWPAKKTGFVLEVGNTYTFRKYNASGPTTGPGTANPDIVQTVAKTQTDTLNSGSYPVYVITDTDGNEQHIGLSTDAQGNQTIYVTQGTISGSQSSFDPPLVVLQGPLQAGTTWSGTTKTKISGYDASPAYTGKIEALEPIDVPSGAATMHFDDALKVVVTYSGTVTLPFVGDQPFSGTETYWFVPYLGPVQHGYSRQLPFQAPTTVSPDLSLVAANVHGVTYP